MNTTHENTATKIFAWSNFPHSSEAKCEAADLNADPHCSLWFRLQPLPTFVESSEFHRLV